MNNHSHPIAHFVGSVPLENAEAVFRTLGETIGQHVQRIPDGETGRRARWISFINDQLKTHPDLEIDPDIPVFQFKQYDGTIVFEVERLRIKEVIDPAGLTFNSGYADDAIRNFATFDKLCNEGTIPAGVKYQICMATTLAIAYNFISPNSFDGFIPAYTAHLSDEFARIADALPHDRISYQWDVCQEVLMWEGYYDQYPGHQEHILSQLGQLGDMVPRDIDLGYHLCYGSPADEHLVQPDDMAVVVRIANGIGRSVKRPFNYIHMPVPQDRSDEAFFTPLKDLSLPNGTALYLGLVHDGDGDNNAAKLAMAQKFTTVGGVGTECGVGRIKDAGRLPNIIDEHRRLAQGG